MMKGEGQASANKGKGERTGDLEGEKGKSRIVIFRKVRGGCLLRKRGTHKGEPA